MVRKTPVGSSECPSEPLVHFLPIACLRDTYSTFRTHESRRVECDLRPLPLRVVPADGGTFEIIDGFKRLAQWRAEGRSEVPVVIESPGTRPEHKRLLLTANQPRRTLSVFDEACVVDSLMTEDGLTPTAVSKLLGRRKEWVLRRLSFVRHLTEAAQQRLACGRLGIIEATLLTSIHLSEQDALLASAERHHLTGIQRRTFFQAWRSAETPSEKKRLLNDPHGTLPAPIASSLSPRAQTLEQQLLGISATLSNLNELFADVAPAEHRRLEALYRSVRVQFESLSSVFPAVIGGSSSSQEKCNECNTISSAVPPAGSVPGRNRSDKASGESRVWYAQDRRGHRHLSQNRQAPHDEAATDGSFRETRGVCAGDRTTGGPTPDDQQNSARDSGTGILRRSHDSGRTCSAPENATASGGTTQDSASFRNPTGAEMQIDWCSESVRIAETTVKMHLLGMILSHSRRLFIGCYRDERESTLLEGLAQGLEYFQGCALRCVFDNMATVVLGRIGPNRQPLWHPRFLEFSRHDGFEPYLCRVADPDRKGKIEKSFRLVIDDFLKGSSFASCEDLQQRIRTWLDRTPGAGNLRVHGTTELIPNDAYQTERDLLIRLPDRRFPVYDETVRAVDVDATISVKGRRYSVPAVMAGLQVTVRLFADHFEVFDRQGRLVSSCHYADPTTHTGNLVIDPTHDASLPRHPGAERGAPRLDQAFIRRFPLLEPLVDGLKQHLKSIASVHLHHLVRLSEEYGLDAFISAVTKAQSHKRFSAHAVRSILERMRPDGSDHAPTLINGLGPTFLGEVEEKDLSRFAALDRLPTTPEADHE